MTECEQYGHDLYGGLMIDENSSPNALCRTCGNVIGPDGEVVE